MSGDINTPLLEQAMLRLLDRIEGQEKRIEALERRFGGDPRYNIEATQRGSNTVGMALGDLSRRGSAGLHKKATDYGPNPDYDPDKDKD